MGAFFLLTSIGGGRSPLVANGDSDP
jgi:hypothetical protein